MVNEVIIYTDYVCPYCLIAQKIVRDEIRGTGLEIRWRPHELRPFPIATLKVEDGYLPAVWERSVYPMANKLNIPIRLPELSPQPRTAKAFEAFLFAEQYDLGDAFSMAILTGFFQRGLDIGQISTLSELATEVGLDAAALENALEGGDFEDEKEKALRHAQNEAGITVVPTILIGDERYEGVANRKWIRDALAKLGLSQPAKMMTTS